MEHEPREPVLELSKIFNTLGVKRLGENKLKSYLDQDTIRYLEEENLIKYWSDRTYIPDFEKYTNHILKMMEISENKPRPCCKGLNRYCTDIKPSNNPLTIRIFITSRIDDNFIECLTSDHTMFIIPYILAPAMEINKINRQDIHTARLRRKLFLGILNTQNILSLFVIPLPFPDTRKILRIHTTVLKELERSIREQKDSAYTNEYDIILNYDKIMLLKTLSPFKFLYKNLKEYAITRLGKTGQFGARPDKWFEEILKALITKHYVETRFPTEIANFIYREYSTGGPCEEDIAIPVKIDGKTYITIIDAKLWAKDICKTILNDTQQILRNPDLLENYSCPQGTRVHQVRHKESLMKYLHYINTKSVKLRRLENIVSRKSNGITGYYLLFIQLKEPCKPCIEKLNNLQDEIKKSKNNHTLYDKIQIVSIDELIGHLQKNNLAGIFKGTRKPDYDGIKLLP